MVDTIGRFHKVDLRGKGFDYIDLVFIGDAHIGHENFRKKEFLKTIEWVKKKDNRFVILMGDLIECLTKTHSPSGASPSKHPTDNQVEKLIDWIKPIKDRILFSVDGNHEERTIKSAGHRILKEPFRLLGIEHRRYEGSIRIMLEKRTYRGYVHHGTGSSLKPDYQLRKFILGAGKQNMDFVAMGHLHQEHRQHFPSEKYIGNRIVKHECLGIRTGGYLQHPDYAKKAGYPPPEIGSPIIRLYNDRHKDLVYFANVNEYDTLFGEE